MKLLSSLETTIISAGVVETFAVDGTVYSADITNIPHDCLKLFISEIENNNNHDQLPTVRRLKAFGHSAASKLAGCKSHRDQFRNSLKQGA